MSAFLARLRQLAKPCKFAADTLEEVLRVRLVCGINHERLQSRLLSESKLTLYKALELAQAHESAAASAAELSGHAVGGTCSEPAVNRLQGRELVVPAAAPDRRSRRRLARRGRRRGRRSASAA